MADTRFHNKEVDMIWSMLAIATVFFGCVTSIVAKEKRRNSLGWFAIGFIYPLLGLILAIVLPPNPARLDVPQR